MKDTKYEEEVINDIEQKCFYSKITRETQEQERKQASDLDL